MALALLLVGLLLWYGLDARSLVRDRAQWPILAAAILGLVLLAKGAPIPGMLLIAGVALWSRRPRRRMAAPAGPVDRGTRRDACDLLGVPPDADRSTILAAHRRLIARNHPDNGGTAGLAARLNAARDELLRQPER